MVEMWLVFAGDDYYPRGGGDDLVGQYASLDSAMACSKVGTFTYDGGWANILHLPSGKVVAQYSRGEWYSPEKSPE